MRGRPIAEKVEDTFKVNKKKVNRYLKRKKLADTKANRKRSRDALKREHDKKMNPPGRELSFQESAADWQIIYGKQRVGGVITYVSTMDDTSVSPTQKDTFLLLVVTIACHQINKITKIFFDDTELTLDSVLDSNGDSANATGAYAGFVFVQVNLGTETQTAISQLVADSAGDWSTDHRQAGCAHIYLRLKFNETLFPTGMPSIHFEVEGKVCREWDAAQGYPAGYSRNPAIILQDLLYDQKIGARRYVNNIWMALSLNDDQFTGITANDSEAAVICDQSVSLFAGGSESRYTCDGTFKSTESLNGIIGKILSSFGGQMLHFGVSFNAGYHTAIVAPTYRTPLYTITENDLLSEVAIATTPSLDEYFGKIGGTYVEPLKNWEETDFPTVIWNSYLSSGVADPYPDREDISLPCTTSHTMAMRLAKLEMLRRKYGLQVSFRTRLNLFKLSAGDNFSLTISALGWTAKVFEVQTLQLLKESDQNGNPVMMVEIVAKENNSTVYAWTNTEEKSISTMPGMTFPSPGPTAATLPSGLVISDFRTGELITIRVEWTAPTDRYVLEGGYIDIQIKETSSSEWQNFMSVPGYILVADILGGFLVGVSYDIRIRGHRTDQTFSDWVTGSHTIAGGFLAGKAMGVLGLTYS